MYSPMSLVLCVLLFYTVTQVTPKCCNDQISLERHDLSTLTDEVFCMIAVNDIRKLDRNGICLDGALKTGSFCGIGSCNIFGCNCDGGCWEPHHAYNPSLKHNCSAILADKANIIKRIKYCVEKGDSPAYDWTKPYKHDCPPTCDFARYEFNTVTEECARTRYITAPLAFGPGIGVPLVLNGACSYRQNLAKKRMDELCGV